jgi:predicted transcriptional regulator
MSSITIHALDPELERRLTEEARRLKRSKNSLVKEMLASSLGLPGQAGRNGAYDEFLGSWSAEEEAAFRTATADHEAIDPGEWR